MNILQPALKSQDWDLLLSTIKAHWTKEQILDLLEHGCCDARKVAALAVGLVGCKQCLEPLSQMLQDPDPMVNEMAEHAMWQIWFKGGCDESNRLVTRGAEALNLHQIDKAIEHLNRAISLNPDFPEAYNQRAIAYYMDEHYDDSIADCKRTVELMPIHFGAWAGMGHCLAATGKIKEAIKCYQKAISINPHLSCVNDLIEELKEQIDNKQV